MALRAFISFEMEDHWSRDFLVEHSRGSNGFEFEDYSVQDPWDFQWKVECKKRLARTSGTIVMIGPTTYRSEAVNWEVAETLRQGHHLFGIQINRDTTHAVPAGIPETSVIRWDFDQIADRLSSWK